MIKAITYYETVIQTAKLTNLPRHFDVVFPGQLLTLLDAFSVFVVAEFLTFT